MVNNSAPVSVTSHKDFRGKRKHKKGLTAWVSYSVKTEVKRKYMIKVSAIRGSFLDVPLYYTVTAIQPVRRAKITKMKVYLTKPVCLLHGQNKTEI